MKRRVDPQFKNGVSFSDGVLQPSSRPQKSLPPKQSVAKKQNPIAKDQLIEEMKEMHTEQMLKFDALLNAIEKLGEDGVAIKEATGIINEPRRAQRSSSANLNAPAGIEMDESVFVTKVDTSKIEKHYDEITETQSKEDESLKSNLSKLRALKKGDK